MAEKRAKPQLGTFVEITLSPGNAAVFEKAFTRIERIQQLMSAHTAESDLAKISRGAHLDQIKVDASTAEVIRHSLKWAEMSNGAFDPVRAGVELVHAGRRPWFANTLPDRGATWRDLECGEDFVKSTRPIAIDLGGVAKGYAVDQAAEMIASSGCEGVVNAGGDIRFIGSGERTLSIRRPDVTGGFVELREIPFPAVATSGSYQYAVEGMNLDLIDSIAGGTVSTRISITVFAANCMLADAMTKVACNLTTDRAAEVMRQLNCHGFILECGGRFLEIH